MFLNYLVSYRYLLPYIAKAVSNHSIIVFKKIDFTHGQPSIKIVAFGTYVVQHCEVRRRLSHLVASSNSIEMGSGRMFVQ